MGRSFSKIGEGQSEEDWDQSNTFYHPASDRYYTVLRRDEKFFLRRHQLAYRGAVTNVVEKQIHYVIGSGNHARSFVHRTDDGRLLELPLGWYAAKGGYWAMSPGYDQPNHSGFRIQSRFRTRSMPLPRYPTAKPEVERRSISSLRATCGSRPS